MTVETKLVWNAQTLILPVKSLTNDVASLKLFQKRVGYRNSYQPLTPPRIR